MTPGALLAAVAGTIGAGGVACFAAWLTGSTPPVPAPPPRWLAAARGWQVTSQEMVAGLAAALVTFAVTGWPVAGIAAAPAAITLPRILSRRPAKARLAKLEALESWTRRLAGMLTAGRGLEDALIASAVSPPPAIAAPVQALAGRLRARGTTARDALLLFAADAGDPVGDLIAAALILAADRRGPGLRAVLTSLAANVGKEVTGRREVEAERASYRSALAWIVVFLAGYLVFLVVNRSYSAPFGTPAGQLVLAVVAGCWAGGLAWLWRLSLIAGPARFLSTPADGGRGRP